MYGKTSRDLALRVNTGFKRQELYGLYVAR
jgi:hypothetical protein